MMQRAAAMAAKTAMARHAPCCRVQRGTARFLSSGRSSASDDPEGGKPAVAKPEAGQPEAGKPGTKLADAKTGASKAKGAETFSGRASPAQNLRSALDALDTMIEEAEKKVEKKYRPNMFAEFKQLNDTDGKVVVGPETLVEVAKAQRVPTLHVQDLNGKDVDLQKLVTAGKVTLVLTSFKNFGLNMLPAWRDGFLAAFPGKKGHLDARVQTLSLNVIEDWYMKLVRGSITSGLQKATPKELHAHTFAHFGRCDAFRTPMELNNSFVGYAHLVDGKGRIRWIAGGPVTPKELERLVKVTKQLLAQSAQARRR